MLVNQNKSLIAKSPFLSIVIITCDKDYKCIEKLCNDINNLVKVSHEIVVIDNREVNKEKLSVPENVFVYSTGKNLYQFEGRRLSVQLCKGQYIWFVDADDEVLFVDKKWEDIIKNEDIILFSAIMERHSYALNVSYFVRSKLLENKLYTSKNWHDIQIDNIWDFFGCCLWDKWIKRNILENVTSLLPKNKVIVASEDKFYIAASAVKSKNVLITTQIIYNYKINNSTCAKLNITYDKFCHIIKGYKDVEKLFNDFIKDPMWQNKSFDFDFFVSKIPCSDNPKKCMEELKYQFGEDYVDKQLSVFLNKTPERYKKLFLETIGEKK